MEIEIKPEHLIGAFAYQGPRTQAAYLNELIREQIAKCPEVYGIRVDGKMNFTVWSEDRNFEPPWQKGYDFKDTHRARLVDLQKIPQ